jgi:hypothetical protein
MRWQPDRMSRSNEHVHGSRRLPRALGLGLSGLALVGLVYFEGMSARAEAEDVVEAEDLADEAELELDALADDEDADADAEEASKNLVPESLPMPPPPSGPAPSLAGPAASPTDGRLAMVTTELDAAAAMPVSPPAPVLVAVPDIEGMSLRKAKKQLAAVGLKLSVRDEYGDKIPREYWSEYKVRKQKLDAGTELAAGSTVKVKARMRMRYAQGY